MVQKKQTMRTQVAGMGLASGALWVVCPQCSTAELFSQCFPVFLNQMHDASLRRSLWAWMCTHWRGRASEEVSYEFQVGMKVPGFPVTCKCALFFYLTVSVVDKCGFITNFFKCFHFGVPFRSFLESWGCFMLPVYIKFQFDVIRLRKRRWSWCHEFKVSIWIIAHIMVCQEAVLESLIF